MTYRNRDGDGVWRLARWWGPTGSRSCRPTGEAGASNLSTWLWLAAAFLSPFGAAFVSSFGQ
jgi:hypothetical protein